MILSSCAVPFLGALSEPCVVVSSIPTVNNSEFGRLRAAVAGAHNAGIVRELITYTYFPHNPFADVFATSKVVALEVRNLPPAFVWKYSV
jgi:phospholipid N-methyltransferase